ncbi:patatin-like phospholipase family protein [Moritella sp. 5]|uniref:patatin-like phospholipase family protein n=1 Tax=Moritella sp. 5 TaxID=2746231 RepID=UPI001BA4B0B1|nr:patatin-like phospholipase family protein [Moritella sp. 5]QUM79077.1 patatin-like phospholipase family protein [Moritella sp. 5]
MVQIKRIFGSSFNMLNGLLLVFISLHLNTAIAAETALDRGHNNEQQRPKIGLALSGGGAKGAAHLGVIKYLEKNNIPIDYIAGTSMGSFIGGMYAMGRSSAQIEAMLAEYDWSQGYNDDVPRDALSVREKQRQDSFQLQTNIGFDGTSVEYPSGFVQGQGMGKLLRLSTNSLPYVRHFDLLPIPYRAVATNIETMSEVVLERGDLSKVMQASMSIPGALTPVFIEGQYLVDGGMVNNLPISVLQDMGADIIIAVDIGSQLYREEEITSAFLIFDQLSSSMTRTSANEQILKLSEQDILLSPEIDGIGTADFDLMLDAVDRGEKSAQSASAKLMGLSLSDDDYALYQQQKAVKKQQLAQIDIIQINDIDITTDTRLSPKVIENKLNLKRGDKITVAELETQIDVLYALNLFQKVDYSITEKEGVHDLHINVVEKSWGPGYVDFKFNIQESTTSDDRQQIGLQYILTDLNRLGAEWRSELVYGTDSNISTEFYSPIDYNQNFFFKSGIRLEDYESKLYLSSINDPELKPVNSSFEYFVVTTEQINVYAELGIIPFDWAQIAVGSYYQTGNADIEGSSINTNFDSQGWYLQTRLDSFDNISFPTKGFKLDSDIYIDTSDYFNSSENNVFFSLDWRNAMSFNRSTFEFKASMASYDGPPISPTFEVGLGGFQNLSGYGINEITGNYKGLVALIYRHRLLDNNFGAFSFPLYLGASIERGNVWNDKDDISFDSTISAGSVFIALDTGIGPVMFSYGYAEGGHASGYLFIGNNF